MAANESRDFRNYYEDEFGDRVRGISKGGDAPTPPAQSEPPPKPGNGSGKGFGGAGFIVLIVVVGLLRAFSSSGSRYSSPPPLPEIRIPPINVNPIPNPPGEELDRILRRLRERPNPAIDLKVNEELDRLIREMEQQGKAGIDGEGVDDLPDPKPDR